jgi:hypothetical protein
VLVRHREPQARPPAEQREADGDGLASNLACLGIVSIPSFLSAFTGSLARYPILFCQHSQLRSPTPLKLNQDVPYFVEVDFLSTESERLSNTCKSHFAHAKNLCVKLTCSFEISHRQHKMVEAIYLHISLFITTPANAGLNRLVWSCRAIAAQRNASPG